MRVLSLTNEFEEEKFGGAGTAVTGMLKMLASQGIQLTVVVPATNGGAPKLLEKENGMGVLQLPRREPYFRRLGLAEPEVILREFSELRIGWDLIHVHASNFASLAYTLSEWKIPILYSVYSFLREELDNDPSPKLQAQFLIQEDLLARCQRIHLVSQSGQDYLGLHFPHLGSRSEVIPLGFYPPERYWQGGNPHTLLFIGRLLPYKGIEDLIKALFQLRNSGRTFILHIIGKGTVEYEAYLKGLVLDLKLDRFVQFHGWETKPSVINEWMVKAGVLIVPSQREAFGLSALEGMAAGIPLVAATVGGLSEFVNPGRALTFKAGDVNQLALVLEKALTDPRYMRQLAHQAQKGIAHLEWSQLVSAYLDLYTRMI